MSDPVLPGEGPGTEPMTDEELAAIEARLAAATPGLWTRFGREIGNENGDSWYLGHDIEGPPEAERGQFERVADAELIANAPADLRRLLDEVQRRHTQAVGLIDANGGAWAEAARVTRGLRTELASMTEFAESLRAERDRSVRSCGELGVELERSRSECAALAAKVDAVREIKPQCRNSAMVTSEQLAMMRGWNDAVDAIRAALEPCTCSLTDPSTWETYDGATEPGSMYERNPDCPAHGDAPETAPGMPHAPAQINGDGLSAEERGTGERNTHGRSEAVQWGQGADCPHRPEWHCEAHGECRGCECGCDTVNPELDLLSLIPDELVKSDPGIRGGEPCITGTRIPASEVAGYLADGATWDEVRAMLPSLPSLPTGEGR